MLKIEKYASEQAAEYARRSYEHRGHRTTPTFYDPEIPAYGFMVQLPGKGENNER